MSAEGPCNKNKTDLRRASRNDNYPQQQPPSPPPPPTVLPTEADISPLNLADPSLPAGKRREIDNVMKKARANTTNDYWDKKLIEAEEKDPNRWRPIKIIAALKQQNSM